jgi:hypothetical protein
MFRSFARCCYKSCSYTERPELNALAFGEHSLMENEEKLLNNLNEEL